MTLEIKERTDETMTVKFMYNGIKVDGKLYKGWYSLSPLHGFPKGTITIYARDYMGFPQIEGLQIENDSDAMTDYFEKDRIRVTPNNKYYPQVLEAYNKQQTKRGAETYHPATAKSNKPAPAPSNVVMLNPDEPATKKQLWALHCITKLDTRDWIMTKAEASNLIGRAKKGENILQFVQQIEKAAR